MYYLQSRYYDATIGRFIIIDTLFDAQILISSNIYSYCYNSPINYSDLNGYFAVPAIATGIVSSLNPIGLFILVASAIVLVAVVYSKAQEDLAKIKNKIPNKLMKNGKVDLSKFVNRNGPMTPKGGRGILGPLGWYIVKDLDRHKGSVWKLFNKIGERIASLLPDGTIIGK